MEFVILIIFELLLMFLEIKIIGKSIFSISFISTATILMSTVAAFYSRNIWKLNLSEKTMLVLVLGLSFMFIAEVFAQKFVISKKNKIKNNNIENKKSIQINKFVLIGINVIVIICFALYFSEVMRVGNSYGATGASCFGMVKQLYINNPEGNYMNIIIRQLFKVVIAVAYVFVYIFVNNIVIDRKIKENLYYLYPVLIGIAITIVSGSRGDILKILAAAIFDFYIIIFAYKNQNIKYLKNIIKKFIMALMAIIVIIFIILFVSKKIVKAEGVATSQIANIVDYIAFYAGSPIAVLNEKIDIKYKCGGFFIGNDKEVPEFVYLGNLDYGGNVSSVFGTSLLNGGYIYMCTYIFLVYLIFGIAIHSIEKNFLKGTYLSTTIILLSYIFNCIIFAFYTDLFSDLFKMSNILTIIIVIIFCQIIKKYVIKDLSKDKGVTLWMK